MSRLTELLWPLHVHEMQTAYQNRTTLSNAESRIFLESAGRNCWKGQKCHWKSVIRPILDSRTGQQKLGRWRPKSLYKVHRGTNPATPFLANGLPHLDR